jgi:hypothetical protein
MPRRARGPLRSCAASASRRARVSVRRTFRRPSARPPYASTFTRDVSQVVSSPIVSSHAAPPFTRLWCGATAGHRRTGGDGYTPGDGLKTLWFKASWLAAAALLRGPSPSCGRSAARPRLSPIRASWRSNLRGSHRSTQRSPACPIRTVTRSAPRRGRNHVRPLCAAFWFQRLGSQHVAT